VTRTPSERAAIVAELRDLAARGFTVREAAAVTGLSRGTVYALALRADLTFARGYEQGAVRAARTRRERRAALTRHTFTAAERARGKAARYGRAAA
jgi:hypothetical protein